MTIYIQKGLNNSNLKAKEINKPLLEYLASEYNYNIVPKEIDINYYKENEAFYFIAGEITENKDGSYTRNNKNMVGRDYAVLDFDNLKISEIDFINRVKDFLKDYSYCLYPTISYSIEAPRYRLLIELERLVNKSEYTQIIASLYNSIGINGDLTASTFSQLQGLPIANKNNKDNYKIIYNNGKPYEVKEIIEKEFNSYYYNISLKNDTLPHEKAVLLFSKYLEVDKNNLKTDYNNSLTVLLTLAKAVITNEIEYHTAIECSKLLAMGNVDYIQGNIEKLENEIKRAKNNINYFNDTYSFKNKIKAPIKSSDDNQARKDLITCWRDIYNKNNFVDIFEDNDSISYKINFKNMNELYECLNKTGEQWRVENTELKKDGTEIVPVMSFTTISSFIRKYLNIVLIGFSEDESSLYYYDYGQGIYINSLHNIKKMISTLENRFNPLKYNQVIEHLKTKTIFTNQLANYKLIACNNGIFNLETKVFEPFSPKYYLTTKLDTNYNKFAIKDYNNNYRSIFDIDKWIMSIANQDTEINTLLWQIINESINPNYTRRKIGIMTGEGQNGKGTYQELLTSIVGRSNVSNLKPQQFNDRFSKSQLVGKILNIGDDISDSYIEEAEDLKSIASGDAITVDRKNKELLSFSFKLFLLFSANKIPKTEDKSKAFLDRLLIIPFNADFSGQKKDINIKEVHVKNKYVLEYALYKALHLNFTHFIEPLAVKQQLKEYQQCNDTVYSYLINEYIPLGLHLLEAVPTIYINTYYKIYCDSINAKARSNIAKELVKHLNRELKKYGYIYKIKNTRITTTQKIDLKNITGTEYYCKSYPQSSVIKSY